MSLGNHSIVRLVKYCFLLEKNANYRTLLKMSIRRAISGFTLVIVCGKLKHLSPKIVLKSQCRNTSRISNQLRKIEFWFIPPKQPFGMVIPKNDIKKSPSALHFKNFRKVRKFTKNTIFIHDISLNFERFQRNITGAKKLLLTSSSSHI